MIIGSVRKDRFGPTVANWLLSQLKEHDAFEVDVIDLADFHLPADLGGGGDSAEFLTRVDRADAFVVVTPEYNHGYPGGLKTAIDTGKEEWKAKAVAFASYGGMAGGLRSVEQLRPVFAELHAVTIRATVSFHWAHSLFDSDGRLLQPEKAEAAVDGMLNQLEWWARMLQSGRRNGDYCD
ncbi:NADPH-dependent oxidoreductase [Micromonospora sp. KC606]|uniref:NADPH-dependent FMN reductase n=1 Tax=Micromonospora sp. KC606 TaxID=2530379 RepID=UPI0010472721|nr:NADPH-dependent oxidoreductase [Micromonospora sp. KC606]